MSMEAGVKNDNFLKLLIWSIFSVVLAFVVKAETMDASNFQQSFEEFVLVLFVGIFVVCKTGLRYA